MIKKKIKLLFNIFIDKLFSYFLKVYTLPNESYFLNSYSMIFLSGVDDSFDPWEKIQSINEFILGNNNVTPCVQRAICDAINRTKSSENKSSSVNEIIDGISK